MGSGEDRWVFELQWRQNSCATKQTGWVGWIAQAAVRGLPWVTEWYTHWVCYPVCQRPIPETHTRHHANHANHACTKQDTRSTISYTVHKTARGMSSRKTSSVLSFEGFFEFVTYPWDHEMYFNFMRLTKNQWEFTCSVIVYKAWVENKSSHVTQI